MTSTTATRRSSREAGRAVREMRMNRGLSPELLGAEINVSGRTIRRIEDGARPTVRVMFALASEFDVEVADLWL
jgi:transcriptional regulator with XRE-family HTH domain